MQKAYKFRIYPTLEQQQLLSQTFGCVRYVWNHVLAWRNEAFKTNQTKINYSMSSKHLTTLKQEISFLKEVSSVALQQTLRHQDSAFSHFFQKRASQPNFKKKFGHQSFTLAKNGFQLEGKKLFLAKCKTPFKVKWSRELEGEVSSLTVSKDPAGRYFVSLLCDVEMRPKPKLTKSIGIDLGLTDFAMTSDGDKYKPIKALAKDEKKLAKRQKQLSKKQKGSKNRTKAKEKVAKVHAKIRDTRHDFLHQLSTKMINENQVIVLEALNVKGMMRNHNLAKAIGDASWSSFVKMLEYKALWYGRQVIKIDPFYPSSQICSACGDRGSKKPLHLRKWTCEQCDTQHDRDVNAAINIRTAGLAGIACGVSAIGQPKVAIPLVVDMAL